MLCLLFVVLCEVDDIEEAAGLPRCVRRFRREKSGRVRSEENRSAAQRALMCFFCLFVWLVLWLTVVFDLFAVVVERFNRSQPRQSRRRHPQREMFVSIVCVFLKCYLYFVADTAVENNDTGVLDVQNEFGSLASFLWSFVPNRKPILNQLSNVADIRCRSAEAEAMSAALLERGFKFVGPTIIYAFMQACVSCFCFFRKPEICFVADRGNGVRSLFWMLESSIVKALIASIALMLLRCLTIERAKVELEKQEPVSCT